MLIRIRFRGSTRSEDQRLGRFRRVLRAARQTLRYRGVLESAGLGCEEDLRRIRCIEEALSRVPRLEPMDMRRSVESFRNPGAEPPIPARFFFPAGAQPRTAVVLSRRKRWFEESKLISLFEPASLETIQRFQPEAIGAPTAFLIFLARMIDSGDFPSFPRLRRGVVAFSGLTPRREGPAFLAATDRDLLWQVFRVPVFEQYLGFDGRLVAWECEAHDGLHVVPENSVLEHDRTSEILFTSLTDCRTPTLRLGTRVNASIEPQRCPCGHAAPLLINLRPVPEPMRYKAAANA
ncbi:MAG: hypothetical protein ACKV22_05925 [Bryobacteraceae bacterium]